MHNYILLLSDLSYELGLIGAAEYEERQEIAVWLSEGERPDPRRDQDDEHGSPHEANEARNSEGAQSQPFDSSNPLEENQSDPWIRFLALNKWMFTVGDSDCYPSVPHGHLQHKTNKWPKLNPYTGRVFSAMHAEVIAHRLNKVEMRALWNDNGFVKHCREQVLWYSNFSPSYGFPKARFGKLRFPRW